MTEETFKTASQMKIEQDEMKIIIKKLAKEMRLRQWCIEHAMQASADRKEIIELAESAYNFITKTE